MKLKIAQAGFENFTGHLAGIPFEDGTSAIDVTEQQASGLIAVMGCDWVNETVAAESTEGTVVDLGGTATAVVGEVNEEDQ